MPFVQALEIPFFRMDFLPYLTSPRRLGDLLEKIKKPIFRIVKQTENEFNENDFSFDPRATFRSLSRA